MKRPRSGDAGAPPRAVSSRRRCVGKGEYHAPDVYVFDCEGTLAFCFSCLDGLSAFILLLITLDCWHTASRWHCDAATKPRRSRPDRHRSVDRRHYLTDDIPFSLSYLQSFLGTFFLFSYRLLRDAGCRETPSISLRYRTGLLDIM
jgi:hypothetical protein